MTWPKTPLVSLFFAPLAMAAVAGPPAVTDRTPSVPPTAEAVPPTAEAETAEPTLTTDERRLRAAVAGLLGRLDSDCYATRRDAAERLEAFVATPDHGPLLAEEFRRALREPTLSFEVRWHLERWRRRLPELPPEPPGTATPDELDRVVRQLDADEYAVRLAAVRRLEWLLGNGKLVGPITARIKARLRSPELPEVSARYLDEVWRGLRPVWSRSEPADWDLPEVSDAAIAGWIDEIARTSPAHPDARRPAGRDAVRELRDLLMRDEYVPRVAAALRARLDEPADARASLEALFEETRPAMVAEYWQHRQHLVEQHLIVGVPSQSVGAARPSHFDRIDNRTARCVSGSSLSPGEYPVGAAFAHPRTTDALFHLVNLPTPRRRLWYQHHVTLAPALRLREISRRTVDRLKEQSRPLDEDDLRLLAGLDSSEVARFAGWYLTAIADSPLPEWQPRPDPYAPGQYIPLGPPTYLGGRPSRHGALCLLLASDGTRAAVPGLLEAIREDRFHPPTEVAPYRLEWIAAFCIAQRDPWSGVDGWLARAVAHDHSLRLTDEPAAEVGATAAAILLGRYGRQFAKYGLQPVGDETLMAIGLTGYRFATAAGRQRVLQWCDEIGLDPGLPNQVAAHKERPQFSRHER